MENMFKQFINTVDPINQRFVEEIHNYLIDNHCTYTIKEAKSGYVITYSKNKYALATYVFRKSGMKIRMYLDHIVAYQEILDTLPKSIKKEIEKASVCKRLLNPEDCNPRCKQGYTFTMDGSTYQKCRFMAFMWNVNQQNNTYIKQVLEKECFYNKV